MRTLLTILIFLFTGGCVSTQQTTFDPITVSYRPAAAITNYSLTWTATNEAIMNKGGYYQVQQSLDTNGAWLNIGAQIKPGSVNYSYVVPVVESYFRVQVVGLETFNLPSIKLTIQNKATIINALNKGTSLVWTVTSTNNVNYYLIQKSSDGKTWTQTTVVPDKGRPGDYTYRMARTVKKYTYRLTTFYKTGKADSPIMFK